MDTSFVDKKMSVFGWGIFGMVLYDLLGASTETIVKFLILQTSPLFLLAFRMIVGGAWGIGIAFLFGGLGTFRKDWYFFEHVVWFPSPAHLE